MRPRKLLLLASLISFYNGAFGEPVGKDKALQVAKDFVSTQHLNLSRNLTLSYKGYGKTDDPAPCYYVFTQEQDKGFVIISGESITKEVIGYSEEGTFDSASIPDGLRYLLEWHSAEVAVARQHSPFAVQQSSTAAASTTSHPTRQAISPMLTTTWDQKAPYNLKCFMANGTQSLAGCVATAMGQVMKFHEWPQSSTTSIPKYTASNGMSYNALPPKVFPWDEMKNAYYPLKEGEEADASLHAVADLMLYCGHAVKMNYKPSSAAASSNLVPYALVNYFGYSDDARVIERSKYNNETWCDILYNELLNRRPVLYAGTTSESLSHIFICDGYDGYGMFHINWGASGKSNGYFSLNSLRPSILTEEYTAFDNSQRMVIGIHPPSSTTDPSDTYLATSQLTTSAATYTFDKAAGLRKTITFSFSGVVNYARTDAAIGIFQNGELKETLYSISNLRVFRDTTITRKPTITFGKGLDNGTYEIHGLNRLCGEQEWRINADSRDHFIQLVVKDDKATLTNIGNEQGTGTVPSLQIVSVGQVFETGVNPKQVRMIVKNTSDVDFIGTAYLILNSDKSLYEGCFVDAGDSTIIDFYTDKPSGSYTAKLQITGNNYNKTFNAGTLVLTNQGSLPRLQMERMTFKNVSGSIHYGRVLDGVISLRNPTTTDYSGLMSYSIHLKDTDNKYQMSQIVNIKAGESADFPLYFENLEFGDKISIVDIGDPYTIYCPTTGIWTVTPGIVTWTASGERVATAPTYHSIVPENAVAASFEGLSLSDVVPNNNENTIYYFDSDAIVPSRFKGKNVVTGNKASYIHFVEGKDFYVPYTFHTSEVSYTRVPESGFDGRGGWQTIMLPFSVDSIHDSSTPGKPSLSWSITNIPSTEGKRLWLRELTSINDDEARFKDVDYWRPNAPYLIAFPDRNWGSSFDLVGHELTFNGYDTDVVKTSACKMTCDGYEFVGITNRQIPSNAYVLNDRGDAFIMNTTKPIEPATAYLLPAKQSGANATDTIHIVNHSALPGDVNGDKIVDISDVMTTVNMVVEKVPHIFIHANGDLDQNGEIDIVDVMMLVWLTLK